jgi:hypothetical protein
MTEEDATFQALDATSEETCGPHAALLCGFSRDEARSITALLEHAAADYRVVCCTTTMGNWTIERALGGDDGGALLPVDKVPRVVLLSGLPDGQVQAVLEAYSSTGIARPIFAVATPANLGFTVIQLLEELIAERQEMA